MVKIGIKISSWNFSEYNADVIAKTFDKSQSWFSPDWLQHPDWDYRTKMNQVRTINPNYKFLVYRNCMSVYDYWADEWNYAKNQGWLLRDVNGKYVTEPWAENYIVDITNPVYQQWVASIIKSWIEQYGFDGVFADNSLKYSAVEFDGSASGRPINPRTGVYFTDKEILDACAGILNAIIDAVGTNKLVMSNGIWNGAIWQNTWSGGDNYRYILSKVPRLNSLFSEGTFYAALGGTWYSESLWKDSVDFVVWIQDNFLIGHPERCFNATCFTHSLPFGVTEEQMILYGYCSMLLVVKYSSLQNTIDFAYSHERLPSTSIIQLLQTLRNIDMSEPLSNYYKISGTSVYTRDFVTGRILVNPTDTQYIITLDKAYKTINNIVVSGSLIVNAHTGVLLFNVVFDADFIADKVTGNIPLTVNFSVLVKEQGVQPYTLTLDYGDDTSAFSSSYATLPTGSSVPITSHLYTKNGQFTATLKLTDSLGVQLIKKK